MTVRIACPAKVNLHLEVLGRRRDGYHELRTVFAPVGVWDELALDPAPAGVFEVSVEPPGAAPESADNLALRAARALAGALGLDRGVRLALRKRIPTGGGLGGGSSDAAAALVGAARLWRADVSVAELAPLAAELGADVPYFLTGGVAWGVGRGSELSPLPDLPPWWVVLLPGPAPISTAEVYRVLDAEAVDASTDSAIYRWVTGGGELPLRHCRNDLQATVEERWPEVRDRLQRLQETEPMLAMLSGSGATVFALYRDESEARMAGRALTALRPLVAPLLGRAASALRPSDGEG